MKTIRNIVAGVAAVLALSSCGTDYLDTEYTRYLGEEEVAEIAAEDPAPLLNGIWSWMVESNPLRYAADDAPHDMFGYMALMHYSDMMSEDIALSASHWFGYDYEFDYRLQHWGRTRCIWTVLYTMIDKANVIISLFPEGAQNESGQMVLGQAQAVRGLAYTLLIQLYQNPVGADGAIHEDLPGVPLIYTATDGYSIDEIDAFTGRNTVGAVLKQAQTDLENAVKNLTESGYVRDSKNNIDAHVANGLLARLYLFTQQWDKAASAANAARQGYAPMSMTDLHDGFMSTSNAEWMWGFEHNTETSTTYASFFSHISNLESGYAGLGYSARLIDARLYSQIPDDDERKTLFNGPDGDASQPTPGAQLPYANLKFGSDGQFTEDYVYMRAAEMYLIEAEALARQGKNSEAATVLGELMKNRQPSWKKQVVTVDDVLLQRRIELWGEGFAYYDLKRNNKGIDRDYEGTNHLAGYELVIPAQDVRWTFQIPLGEIQENSHISEADQND
ncbi:MAG: RagB/SusD family nutrient uptake outer membrane protein [Bacteroidaceae bacterium]|nr:RagB/SusD family nutrient uptake outer membrane protein [Bacteroidaceae bacterium]